MGLPLIPCTMPPVRSIRSLSVTLKTSDLLDFLGELTTEEANKLLYSSEDEVREYAIKYADRKSKIDRLLVEYNSNIVKGILNTIGELTPEEANKLLNSKNRMVKIYAMRNVNSKDLAELREIIVKGLIKWL